jgi:enoyl-CoA hydratase
MSEREYEFLSFERRGAVLTVWLSRPPVNAVNQQMYRELAAFFADPNSFDGVRVVILAARGPHFCAGNDLAEFATMTPQNAAERMAEVRAAFFAIQDCPVPVIGAVHGAALGTGLAIAASCDFVVASEDARFGTPEVGVGIMGGARHLARLVSQPWVRYLYFTADPVPAATIAGLGGVIEVVHRDDLLHAAGRIADRVARHSEVLLRTAKRSLNGIESMELQSGYAFEQGLTVRVCGEPHSQEAVLAALERREPSFVSFSSP